MATSISEPLSDQDIAMFVRTMEKLYPHYWARGSNFPFSHDDVGGWTGHGAWHHAMTFYEMLDSAVLILKGEPVSKTDSPNWLKKCGVCS
jgi:hypothetical protein